MTLEWQDNRIQPLSSGVTFLDVEEAVETLWVPDIWVESLRDFTVHRSIKDQATFKITNHSYVYYWQR